MRKTLSFLIEEIKREHQGNKLENIRSACNWLKKMSSYGEAFINIMRKECLFQFPVSNSFDESSISYVLGDDIENLSYTVVDELLKVAPLIDHLVEDVVYVILEMLQEPKYKKKFSFFTIFFFFLFFIFSFKKKKKRFIGSYINSYLEIFMHIKSIGPNVFHKISPQLFHMTPLILSLSRSKFDFLKIFLDNLVSVFQIMSIEENNVKKIDFSIKTIDSEVYRCTFNDFTTIISVNIIFS